MDRAAAARVRGEAAKLGGDQEFELKYDVDIGGLLRARAAQAVLTKESNRLSDVFNRSSLSIGQMTSLLVFASPVIYSLAGALGALTASLGAATAGFGALSVGAVGALSVGFAGVTSIIAPAIGGLSDLMSAQESANKAQVTGADSAARSAASGAQQIRAAREQVVTATQGVEQAEESLEAAQDSARFAQEELTEAREEATRQLQDMRRAVVEGATAEQRSQLTLRQARRNLEDLIRSGTASALDLESAQLDIVEARQGARDATIEQNRAEEDLNRAQRGGIKNMPQMVAAQRALNDAMRGVKDAQQGVADAHQDVSSALRDLAFQQKQVNQATAAGGTAMAALELAQRKAGPMAVRFARNLKDLQQRWSQLTRGGQTQFFGLLNDGLDRLNRKLPLFADSANRSMGALRRGFNAFLDRATGPEFDRFINVMTRTFAKSIGPVSKAFGNIAKVLQRIAVAVAPDIIRIAGKFEEMTKGWLDSTKNARGLRRTVHGLVKQTEAWWDLLVAAKNLVVAALVPGMGAGKDAVKGMTEQLQEWTRWVNAHPEAVKDFFKEGTERTGELAKALLGMMPALTEFAKAIRPVSDAFVLMLKGLNALRIGNVSALTVLLFAFAGFRVLRAFQGIREAVAGIASSRGLGRVAGRLRSILDTVRLQGMYAREGAQKWISEMAGTIRARGGKVRDAIRGALSRARVFVSSAATGAAEWIGGMVGSIRSSRLADKLRGFFRRVAQAMGKVMAAAIAGAVVVGEGVGGAAASLTGLLRGRLVPRLKKIGRLGGKAFGIAFVAGFILALPQLAKELRKRLPGQGGDDDLGGALWKDSPFSVDLPGKWWSKGGLVTQPERLLKSVMKPKGTDTVPAMLTPGEFVVRREAVEEVGVRTLRAINRGKKTEESDREGFQRGGMVGGRRVQGVGSRDKIPALLEVGELVIPKKLVDDAARGSKKVAVVLKDEIGKGYKKVSEDSKDFVKRHGRSMEDLRKKAADQTKRFRKTTVDDFEKTDRVANERTDRMQVGVTKGFDQMRSRSVAQTGRMKQGVGQDFQNMTGAVSEGLRRIAKMTNNSLKALGVKKVDFRIAAEGKQRGGLIPGTGDGDKVPVMAEPGEGFINKKAVRALGGKEAIDKINKVVPRFKKGGVVRGPFQSRSDVLGSGPGFVPYMNYLNSMFGPLNVISGIRPGSITTSGNVSNHSWGGAVDISTPGGEGASQSNPMTGSMGKRMDAAHSWIRRYFAPMNLDLLWRTLTGGNHYNHIHSGIDRAFSFNADKMIQFISKLPKGGGFGNVRKVELKGPDGPLKDLGQAALDKVRAGANQLLRQKAGSAQFGARQMGDVHAGAGALSRPEMRQLLRANNLPDIMGWVAGAESLWNPSAHNVSGASGLWQIMMPLHQGIVNGNVFDPNVNARAAATLYRQSGLTPWAESQYKGAIPGGWSTKVGQSFQKGGMVAAPHVDAFAGGGEVRIPRKHFIAEVADLIHDVKGGKRLQAHVRELLDKPKKFGFQRGGMVAAPYVGAFREGGEVKKTGLGLVHQGEQVVPKRDVRGFGVERIRLVRGRLSDQINKIIPKFEERIDIAERLAGLASSEAGSELSKGELTKQLGLQNKLLAVLRKTLKITKRGMRMVEASIKKIERDITQIGNRIEREQKKDKPDQKKIKGWQEDLRKRTNALNQVRVSIPTFRDTATEMAGLTGGGGRIFDTSIAIKELKSQGTAEPLHIAELLEFAEALKFGAFKRSLGTQARPLPTFAQGGTVPGPLGKPVPVIAHGGERFLGVGGQGAPVVEVKIAEGMGWLRKFIDVEVTSRERRERGRWRREVVAR